MEERLSRAEELCIAHGGNLTPLRRKLLAYLLEADRPVKAYDLLTRLQRDQSAKPPTAYRTLDFLREMGLVHKMECMQAFVACQHWGRGHAPIFLICDSCQHVDELEVSDSLQRLLQGARAVTFLVREAVLELRGVCGQCRSNA